MNNFNNLNFIQMPEGNMINLNGISFIKKEISDNKSLKYYEAIIFINTNGDSLRYSFDEKGSADMVMKNIFNFVSSKGSVLSFHSMNQNREKNKK